MDRNLCAQVSGVQFTEIEICLSMFPFLEALVSYFQMFPHIHQGHFKMIVKVLMQYLVCVLGKDSKLQELARLMIWWD